MKIKNPFLSSVSLQEFVSEKVEKWYTPQGSSEQTVITTLSWEKDNFTKLYNDTKLSNIFREVSPTACKLFIYIAYNIHRDTDVITLKLDACKQYIGIESNTTYYKYLQELIDNAVIAKKSQSEFWVNPLLIFNGDRLKYYKEQCPECIQTLNIKQMNSKNDWTFKKKKDLMNYFKVKDYYNLKKLLGQEQIDLLLKNKLSLEEVKLLK